MFFCLWAALFCYVSVRGCRNERVRATCTAFDDASMAWRAACFRLLDATKNFVDNWVGFCAVNVLRPRTRPGRSSDD